MELEDVLRLAKALRTHGVEYVVVGGVAINIHGLARATADIDLFVAPDADNIARLRAALTEVFEDPEIAAITSEDLAGRYPAIQYVPPSGMFHIDILARLGEAFEYSDIEFQEIEVEGTPVRVATAQMLFRMKRGTVRAQDQADAERLARRFGLEDE